MQTIILCPGDPAGIGPEICAKALAVLAQGQRWIVLCDSVIFLRQMSLFAPHVQLVEAIADKSPMQEQIQFLLASTEAQVIVVDPSFLFTQPGMAQDLYLQLPTPTGEHSESIIPGRISALAGLHAFAALQAAVQFFNSGLSSKLVTGCINKEALRAAGVPYIGHTEILADLSNAGRSITMFQTENLRIFFLSRHVSLAQACAMVTRTRVLQALREAHWSLERLGFRNPHIAVAGLNPHCGEHGLFGDEEVREIEPAIHDARIEGIRVTGPIGADSIFYQCRQGMFDAVLSLYHDQGHIAAKTWDFDRTITMTLGLPFLRVSVDHGTAMDIAGKGIAQSASMETAMACAINQNFAAE